MSDKKGIGGRKGLGVQKDRQTRVLKLPTIDKVGNKIIIPNIETFKTTQIHLCGWIRMNPELEQYEADHILLKTRRNIKYRMANFAKRTGKYQQENIVIIETGTVNRQKKQRNYQFVNIDLTLYNKSNIYDKANVKASISPLIRDIIQNDLIDTDVFNFILKQRGTIQYGE